MYGLRSPPFLLSRKSSIHVKSSSHSLLEKATEKNICISLHCLFPLQVEAFRENSIAVMSLQHANSLVPQPWTDVFTNDTSIDRRTTFRTVPMKVLALSVGRTGTACESQSIMQVQ